MYGDLKTSGYNVRGRIVQERNALGRNVRGCIILVPYTVVSCSRPWNRWVRRERSFAQQHSLKIGSAWAILGGWGEALRDLTSTHQTKSSGSICRHVAQVARNHVSEDLRLRVYICLKLDAM